MQSSSARSCIYHGDSLNMPRSNDVGVGKECRYNSNSVGRMDTGSRLKDIMLHMANIIFKTPEKLASTELYFLKSMLEWQNPRFGLKREPHSQTLVCMADKHGCRIYT